MSGGVVRCHELSPIFVGREFVLACDYEPVHSMTYINNPGARLLRWRLRLQGYQYKFEYKQGKMNRGVEALSGNSVANDQYTESTDSTDSYDSDDSNKCYKSSSLRNNSEDIKSFISKPSDIRKVLVITRSGTSRAEPTRGEPSSTSREPSDSTGRITQQRNSNSQRTNQFPDPVWNLRCH